MLRLILIAIVLLLAAVGGLAVALNHFFGWKGLVAFPFIVIVLVWLVKMVIGKLIKRFFLRLFSLKSRILRGATMTVHSITPVSEPPKPFREPAVAGADDDDETESETDKAAAGVEANPDEAGIPKHYYAVDVTITPKNPGGDSVWEPGEFILASEKVKNLEDLGKDDKQVGSTHEVLVWDGSAFGPDDPGKYPGEQRLNITFAVEPGTSQAWLHYYNEPIGLLSLPAWKPGGNPVAA